MQQVVTGGVDGTGANITINCGFEVEHVEIIGQDTGLFMLSWSRMMKTDTTEAVGSDGYGFLTTGSTGVITLLTSAGITPIDVGDSDSAVGFTIGINSANADGKWISWKAVRKS